MTFMDQDFLLNTETAKGLYHNYAEHEPIFDYHNHLSSKDIAEHRRLHNLYEAWLETDHYKWRAMRACGIPEKYITGDAEPYEKFEKWAEVLPKLAGSPLYHWTHLELQRYFGIHELLTPVTAEKIWKETEQQMLGDGFDTVSLLQKMNVRVLCTTDDPADTLEWHAKIAEDDTIGFRVLPSFRPDKYLMGTAEALAENRKKLCERFNTSDLKTAFHKALNYFCERGCLVSDHGFGVFPYATDPEFRDLMLFLGKEYAERGIAMQLHLGPIRNTVPSLMKSYGADAGADSVGPATDPFAIASFLSALEGEGKLPNTILYNLNPVDNTMLATMAGNYAPKVQFGAAWWFNDHFRGINAQLDELMENGTLSAAVGMLTDSRSFTSFVRHEYYRRILCRKLGELVAEGMYPDDIQTLGRIVRDVCFANAENFFEK